MQLSPLFQTQPSEQHVHERLRGSRQHQSQNAEPGQRRGEASPPSTSAWNACCMSLLAQRAQWLLSQTAFAVSGYKARRLKSKEMLLKLQFEMIHVQVDVGFTLRKPIMFTDKGEKKTLLGALG